MTAYDAGTVTLEQVREYVWEIAQTGGMNAPARVLASEQLLDETFGSTAHGAGRLMSRTEAKNTYWGEDVVDDLREGN